MTTKFTLTSKEMCLRSCQLLTTSCLYYDTDRSESKLKYSDFKTDTKIKTEIKKNEMLRTDFILFA